ncbi:MAG: DUF362 domain-containing protein [Methanomassiliicoccales archaeon]|nr:MAG: DUF362 domain-containing protein [Methanomassiliicoccales archaeon]
MTVFFDEVAGYHRPSIQDSILRAFRELGIDVNGKKSAFIKPNIVRPAKPNSCVVTHPLVVEALVNVLRNFGVNQITIGDGPAAGVDVNAAFKESGYLALAEKMRVRLLNINEAETVKEEWPYGLIELPLEVIRSDLYINVAKMKTHFHTGVTLSIKNQQGLLTPQAKKANHRDYDLHESLLSIAKVVHPTLIIIDAIHSMEGEGPTKGRKKHAKVIVYGEDMFETDIACCYFMGVPLSQIKYLSYAIEGGLGSSEPEIRGKAFTTHRTLFEMPSPRPKQILNFYSWKNYRACAEDEHSFEEAIHLALIKPKYWFTFFPKFLYFVLFKRFDLLRGKEARIPQDAGRILCIGDCCRDVASENGAHFVPGCPPKPEDILKTIARMK